MVLQKEEERKAQERSDRRRSQRARYRNPNFVGFGDDPSDFADYIDHHHAHAHNHNHGSHELDEGLPANFRRMLSAEERHAQHAQQAQMNEMNEMEQFGDSDEAVMSAFSQPFMSDAQRMELLLGQMEHLRSMQQHEAAVNGL